MISLGFLSARARAVFVSYVRSSKCGTEAAAFHFHPCWKMRWTIPLTPWNNRVVFGKAAAQLGGQSTARPVKVAAWGKSWCLSRAISKGTQPGRSQKAGSCTFKLAFLLFVLFWLCLHLWGQNEQEFRRSFRKGAVPRLQEVDVQGHSPA